MCKPLRNFDKFEEGHYYVYIGEKTDDWVEKMDAVLERKIHKCIDISSYDKKRVKFEGVEGYTWYYGEGE